MSGFQLFKDRLNDNFHNWEIQFRLHATQRMFQRNFFHGDIINCLENGHIIENYGNDLPFPSVLINGNANNGRPLHMVVGVDNEEKRLYIITVYEPDALKWYDNYNRRNTT